MAEILELLIIGALMGMLGQGVRAVVGLKSMADDAKALGLGPNDLFEAARLITSFLIGGLVGLASALIYYKTSGATNLTADVLLAWVAAGYGGTDFLEGFISQYLPAATSKVKTLAVAGAANPPVKKPTYSPDVAWGFVQKAFTARGKPNVKQSDVLSDPPIGYTTFGDFHDLLVAVNDQMDPQHGCDYSDMVSWEKKGKKVSDVVQSVEYARPIPAS